MLSSSASLRGGIALAVWLGAVASIIAACGSLNSAGFGGGSGGNPDAGFNDAGATDAPGFPEGSTGDSAGIDAPADGGLPAPSALFIQASPSLSSVRLCWSANGTVMPTAPFPSGAPMPGSNYSGIPLGGVAAMSVAAPLAGQPLQLYAVDAKNLARIELGETTPLTCDQLVCPGSSQGNCLRPDLDYWPVGSAVTIPASGPSALVVGGCLAGFTDAGTAPSCGATWTPNGNLHADVVGLTTSVPSAGALSVQATLLAPALAAALGDGGAATITYGPASGQDAGAVAKLSAEGQTGTPVQVPLGASIADYGQLGFAVSLPASDGGSLDEWMSLAQSQQLVDPTQDPSVFYAAPRTYLLAVLGDPTATPPTATTGDAGYDGAGLHILLIPTPAPPPDDAGDP
jgi:hypothetical protein